MVTLPGASGVPLHWAIGGIVPKEEAASIESDWPAESVRCRHSRAAPSSSQVESTVSFKSPAPICCQTLAKFVPVQASADVTGTRRIVKLGCPGHVAPPTAPELAIRRGTPESELARYRSAPRNASNVAPDVLE